MRTNLAKISFYAGRDSETGLSIAVSDKKWKQVKRADVYVQGLYIPLNKQQLQEIKEEIEEELSNL